MMKGLFILLCSFLLCSASARDGDGSLFSTSADHPATPGLMGSTSVDEHGVESDTTPQIKSNTTASVSGDVKTESVTSGSTDTGTGVGAGLAQLGNETETESEKLRFDYPNLEQPKEKSDSNFMNYTQQVKNFTQKFTQTLGQQILELFQSKNQTKMSDEAGSRDAAEDDDAAHPHVDSGEGEAHETQDLHIQDLLRGILVDEFESGEDESAESAESVESDELESFFHDGSDGNQEQDEDIEEDEQVAGVFITTDAPESSSTSTTTTTTTTTPTTTSTNAKTIPEDVGEQDDRLTETKAEVDADIVKDRQRTGRASISIEKNENENDRSDGLVKSGRGRGSGKEKGSGSGSNVDKYNRYVDAVFKRMNSLIRAKRMDPLRVNLYAGSNANNASHHHVNNNSNNNNSNSSGGTKGTKGSSGGKINKNKNSIPNKNKKNAPTAKPSNIVRPGKNQNVNQKNRNSNNNNNNKNNRVNNNSNNNNNNKQAKINRNHHHYSNKRRVHTRPKYYHRETQVYGQRRGRAESSSSQPFTDSKMRPSSMESISPKGNKTSVDIAPSSTSTTTTEKSIGTSTSPSTIATTTNASESKEMKGQSDSSSSRPNNSSNNNRPTRGVLHGLSTLRRSGPVKVIRQGPDVRLVRAKFLLGPVALDILPKKSGNSSKASNTATATATARSLKGMLEIRLKNSSPTRIRRLRVFPPSNVRVEGETKGIKKQGYRKITPVAARRLMNVANQVVRQSDNNKNKAPATRTHNKDASPKNAKRNQNKTPTRPHQKQ